MADCTAPAFFKVLLDPSAQHLPLPQAFVTKHLENKIPKNPTLESARGGISWRLKIAQIGGIYYFTHGWSNVVRDIRLGFGDFLVFRFVHQSTFRVEIFAPDGCQKDLPISRIKVENDVDVDVDVDDEDDVVDDDVIVYESGNEVDEEEEEEDDEEEDDEEDDDSGSNGGSDGGSGGDDDDEDGGDIDGNDGDPFFMTIIHNNLLRLPSEFVRLSGIANKKTIALKNDDDQEWQLGMRSEKNSRRCHLSPGWNDFRRSNGLSEGDECVFKFLRSEGKLCLVKVTKKKRVARHPPAKIPATKVVGRNRGPPPVITPAVEVVKRKRGRPFKDRGRVDTKSEDVCVEVVQKIPSNSPRQKSLPATVERKRGRPVEEIPVTVERKRGRPAAEIPVTVERKRGGPAAEIPVTVERKRGRPAAEIPVTVERKRGLPAAEIPVTVERKRGRPAAEIPATVERKRERLVAEIPATMEVIRKRGRPFKNRGPVEIKSEDDCVEVVQKIPANSPRRKSQVVYF